MEFWLDTIQANSVKSNALLGLITGVTTNPELLGKAKNVETTLLALLESFEGPLAVQVQASTSNDMVAQGKTLYDFSDRIIVKVPVTQEGLKTIYALTQSQIPTMGTCVFAPEQALLAAKAGADYVALYLTRLEKSGGDSIALLKASSRIFQNYHFETKLLAASISHVEQVEKCAELAIHAVTLRENVFKDLIEDHPLTLDAIQYFNECFKAEDASLLKPRHTV